MKLQVIFVCIYFIFTLIQVIFAIKKTYQIIFPADDGLSYAKLLGTIDRHLNEFTLCQWSRINSNNFTGAIFSYAEPSNDNSILVMLNHTNQSVSLLQFYQNNNKSQWIDTEVEKTEWIHTCIVWSNVEGLWQVYVNGRVKQTGKGLSPDSTILPNGVLILGQDQDSPNQNFDKSQSHKGQISEVNVWNFPLSAAEISKVYHCNYTEEGNVLSWNLETWSLYNGARISMVILPCGNFTY